MRERQFAPVKNNNEKEETYRYLLGRLARAKRGNFNFEGIHLCYALIEDRSRSFFVHIGLLQTMEGKELQESVRSLFLSFLRTTDSKVKKPEIRLSANNGKMALLKAIAFCCENGTKVEDGQQAYFVRLQEAIRSFGTDRLSTLLLKTEKWVEKRNELVHALANKPYREIDEKLPSIVEEGENLFRELCELVKAVKRKSSLRRLAKSV